MTRLALPVLVTMTVFEDEVVPTCWLGKLTEPGEIPIAGFAGGGGGGPAFDALLLPPPQAARATHRQIKRLQANKGTRFFMIQHNLPA